MVLWIGPSSKYITSFVGTVNGAETDESATVSASTVAPRPLPLPPRLIPQIHMRSIAGRVRSASVEAFFSIFVFAADPQAG